MEKGETKAAPVQMGDTMVLQPEDPSFRELTTTYEEQFGTFHESPKARTPFRPKTTLPFVESDFSPKAVTVIRSPARSPISSPGSKAATGVSFPAISPKSRGKAPKRTPVASLLTIKSKSSALPKSSASPKSNSNAGSPKSKYQFDENWSNDPANRGLNYKPKPAKPPRFAIFGAPGSGKGTQMEALVAKFNMVHISTGDLLREGVASGSAVGQMAAERMKSGKLVDDDIIIALMDERLRQRDVGERGFLIDGFPRTASQAARLEQLVKIDLMIVLEVPFNVLERRITGRLVDPVTGQSYHRQTKPPPDQIAHRCVQRADDTPEALKQRLDIFSQNLTAIMEHYDDRVILVNGNQYPEAVAADMLRAIDGKIRPRMSSSNLSHSYPDKYFYSQHRPIEKPKSGLSPICFM